MLERDELAPLVALVVLAFRGSDDRADVVGEPTLRLALGRADLAAAAADDDGVTRPPGGRSNRATGAERYIHVVMPPSVVESNRRAIMLSRAVAEARTHTHTHTSLSSPLLFFSAVGKRGFNHEHRGNGRTR